MPIHEQSVSELYDLSGRSAVVTGAGNGIGRATAHRLAAVGASVLIADRDADAAQRVTDEIVGDGGAAVAAVVDVAREDAGEQLVRAVESAFGGVAILVNGAGIFPHADLLDLGAEEWDRIHRINLRGSFLAAQACGRHMVGSDGGAIVNIASRAATRPPSGMVAYATSKAGVIALTRSLALELAPSVRVNAVAPGAITDTASAKRLQREFVGPDGDADEVVRAAGARVPLGRTGRADEVARVIVFLATEASSYVNGTVIAIDGGDTIS